MEMNKILEALGAALASKDYTIDAYRDENTRLSAENRTLREQIDELKQAIHKMKGEE